MYARVTLPVDTTSPDIEAIAITSALARRLNVPMDMVTVSSDISKDERSVVLHELATIPGVTTVVRVLIARDVEDALYRDAREHPDGLWCVPTRAKWGIAEALLGSVSEEFVRDVGAAVMLVGPHAERTVADGGVLVVSVDGTSTSEAILPAAVELAVALRLKLRLLQVIDLSEVPEGMISEEANLVRNLAEDWATPDFPVDFEVLHGPHPSSAIVDYVARQPEVVLLAMATHGVPAQARVVYPSQTFRVVRHSVCPVIALHPIPALVQPERRNVVVAGIDDAGRSKEVIDVAVAEAKARGAKLLLIHTWQEPVMVGPDFTGMYAVIDYTALENAQVDVLDEALTHARQLDPALDVIGTVTRGRTSDVLVDYSRSAELVVVGSHHHGAFAEALLGSVSSAVGRRASCPVIVVPCAEPVR